MDEILRLLLGTVLLRPYVFVFLAVYLAASCVHLGWRRTILFLPLGYGIAWLSEFSSIHWGFPYGDYFYIPATVDRELWVFGVPFMDSLSYVFLSYCSYSMAIFLLSPLSLSRPVYILETHRLRRSWQTLTLGAFLFVLLDIIIDPVALQGSRWFLGQIYGYRTEGLYFGIPMSNFGGWLLVGFAMIGALQLLDRVPAMRRFNPVAYHRLAALRFLGPVLYVSILMFNLTVTFLIGETLLGMVGCLILFFPTLYTLFFTMYKLAHVAQGAMERHLEDFPYPESRIPIPSPASNPALSGHIQEGRQGKIQEIT